MPTLTVTHYTVPVHRDGDPMPKARDIMTFKSPTGQIRVLNGWSTNADFKPIFDKVLPIHNETVEMEFSIEEMKVIKKYSSKTQA
jgi:hypothetical protein